MVETTSEDYLLFNTFLNIERKWYDEVRISLVLDVLTIREVFEEVNLVPCLVNYTVVN